MAYWCLVADRQEFIKEKYTTYKPVILFINYSYYENGGLKNVAQFVAQL